MSIGSSQGANGHRIGVWLVGSRGSVATTTVVGAGALAAALVPPTGLVTMTNEPFAGADLPAIGDLVFGGHDVVETPIEVRAAQLAAGGVLPPGMPSMLEEHIRRAEAEQRLGITGLEARERPRAAADRVAADLEDFRDRNNLEGVVVLNVASTEAPIEPHPAHADSDELLDAVARGLDVLPPSSLYALAAIESGCAYIDFTPSTGARLPALELLSTYHGVPLAGRDGKTGETFMKTALAPAFAARALRVHSWAATNLLGGGDGLTLAQPDRARSKLQSKARCLEEILGYPLEAPVRIDQLVDLGEWKTAWDHITFEGFLGVRMKMQFIWEGCDSALAAPLLIDLARFGALALERGETGVVPELAFFFKDPAGTNEHALDQQYRTLQRWVRQEVSA
jgi:myo-inositol-1-phosphate synthase